ncbi:MAG: hypothetical protein RBS99_03035 [Rhodospirillales bacterium]|jgi:hypothetical protein|nr:hypothetical protein [Rhodospirillales bacterium]
MKADPLQSTAIFAPGEKSIEQAIEEAIRQLAVGARQYLKLIALVGVLTAANLFGYSRDFS